MARQYGRTSKLYLRRESSYGTPPAGNYNTIPFTSTNLGLKRGLIDSPRAGAGTAMNEVIQDVQDVGGDLEMPLCMRNAGFLLTGLLGDPSTSGAGTYTHTFTSEAATLPSYAIEVAHDKAGTWEMNAGIVVNTMALDFQRSGFASARFGLLGKTVTPDTETNAGTPTVKTLAWASQFNGTVKKGGSNLGNVNSASLLFSNNYEAIGTLNEDDGVIAGYDRGAVTCTGGINMRFADTTLLDIATSGTPVDLEFLYTVSASLSLAITVHEAYLEKSVPPVDGPGGINVDLNWRAVWNTSASKLLTAVLVNDQAGTVYTS